MLSYSELVGSREIVPLVVVHSQQGWPLAVATCLRGLLRQGAVERSGDRAAIQVCAMAEAAATCRTASTSDFSRSVHPFMLSSAGNAWLVGLITNDEALQFEQLCREVGSERTNRRFEFLPIQDGNLPQCSWVKSLGIKSILVSPGREGESASDQFAQMLATYVLGSWEYAKLNNHPALEDAFHLDSPHGMFSIGYSVDQPDVDWHSKLRGAELKRTLAEVWLAPTSRNLEFPPIAPTRRVVADLIPPKAYTVAPDENKRPGVEVNNSVIGLKLENPSPIGSIPSTTDRWHWPQHRQLFKEVDRILRSVYLSVCNIWVTAREKLTADEHWTRWSGEFRLPERPLGAFTFLEHRVEQAIDSVGKMQTAIVATDNAAFPLEQNLARLDRAVAKAPTAGGLALRVGYYCVVTFWLVFGLRFWAAGTGSVLQSWIRLLAITGSVLAVSVVCAAIGWYAYTRARIHRQLDVTAGDLARVHLTEVGQLLAAGIGQVGRVLDTRLQSLASSIRDAHDLIGQGGGEPTPESNRYKAYPAIASQIILKSEEDSLLAAAHQKVRAIVEENRTHLIPQSWPEHLKTAAYDVIRRRLEAIPYMVWARASLSAADRGWVWRNMLKESEIPLVGTERRLEDPIFFGAHALVDGSNTHLAGEVDLDLPFVVMIRVMALVERKEEAAL